MFGLLFKQKNTTHRNKQEIASALYQAALSSSKKEVFYTRYGVPDTFDGRFDLLLLHLFLILRPLTREGSYEKLSQAVFDTTFRNMDQTLREMGIGDMGIPKHMKRMMKAFNGRMHSYQEALFPGELENIEGVVPSSVSEVLRRNLYGTVEDNNLPDENIIKDFEQYIRQNAEQDHHAIAKGVVHFKEDKEMKND
ncbi:MAG: ubiquinol-cytochrome C chaperone family protein [Alphaproteobacteria bacterium]